MVVSLGSNVLSLVASQPLDAAGLASTPAKVFAATRELVPRLAAHVSPSALLNNLVREVNDFCDPSPEGTEEGLVPLTERTLRQHNQRLSRSPPTSASPAAALGEERAEEELRPGPSTPPPPPKLLGSPFRLPGSAGTKNEA